MVTLLVVFLFFLLMVLGMAVGVLLGRKPIAGSCGGLGSVGVEKACGCTDSCKNSYEQKSPLDK